MELKNGVKAVTTLQLNPVTESEQDVSYSIGFLEHWFADDTKLTNLAKLQLLGHVKTLAEGIKMYRDKYLQTQEDLLKVRQDYNNLTGLSASYLQLLDQQKQQLDQYLIEEQRPIQQKYIET